MGARVRVPCASPPACPPRPPPPAPRLPAARTEDKPSLAGITVKTRKRNIVVPSDPGSFADALVQIIQDASDGKSLESDLEASAKALDSAELEYARYGDTVFEVFFTGGRLATGAALAEGGARLDKNVGGGRVWGEGRAHARGAAMRPAMRPCGTTRAAALPAAAPAPQILAGEPTREAVLPYIRVFQGLTRCAAAGTRAPPPPAPPTASGTSMHAHARMHLHAWVHALHALHACTHLRTRGHARARPCAPVNACACAHGPAGAGPS